MAGFLRRGHPIRSPVELRQDLPSGACEGEGRSIEPAGPAQPARGAEQWPDSEALRFGRGLALALTGSIAFWVLLVLAIWRSLF